MTAEIKRFPFLHGNPRDPDVEVIQHAMANAGKPMTDAAARTFVREFHARLMRRATRK